MKSREKDIAQKIQLLNVRKHELSVSQEDYEKAKQNYEMIKKDIDPKLEKLKAEKKEKIERSLSFLKK